MQEKNHWLHCVEQWRGKNLDQVRQKSEDPTLDIFMPQPTTTKLAMVSQRRRMNPYCFNALGQAAADGSIVTRVGT